MWQSRLSHASLVADLASVWSRTYDAGFARIAETIAVDVVRALRLGLSDAERDRPRLPSRLVNSADTLPLRTLARLLTFSLGDG